MLLVVAKRRRQSNASPTQRSIEKQWQNITVTRTELIAALHARFRTLTAQDIDASAKLILSELSTTLAAGGRIEIRGFGSFDLKYRKPRIARNPTSGEKVSVPGKYVPHFNAGKELRERVDSVWKRRF
jgi:integration host factor subunit beta